jgi:cyclophilin family peptidyl-prolyl cis-trans isomerase
MDRNTLGPDLATSQFFINLVDNIPRTDTNLDYGELAYNANDELFVKVGYCVFGRVVSGMEVVDAIAAVPVQAKIADDGKLLEYVPVEDIIIQSATVTGDVPFCAEKVDGDVDGNCIVDLADFVKIAQNWLACNSLTPACP